MSRKFLTDIDLAQSQLLNARVQNLGSAPSSPQKGQLYYNNTGGNDTLYWWDGTTWQSAKGGAPSGAAGGDLTGTYPNPTIGTGKVTSTHILDDTILVADINSSLKDPASGSYGLRTLSTGSATSAMPGNTRLDQITAPTASVSMNAQTIINLNAPVNGTDATTKNYVDGVAQGLDAKASVLCASTGNLTLSGLAAIDGITPIAGDRILAKDQSTSNQNGIYTAAAGAWTRATDMDAWAEFPNAYVWVERGTANVDTGWVCTVDQGGTLGSTSVTWVQFASAGVILAGNGLLKTGNTIDVVPTATISGLTVNADDMGVAWGGSGGDNGAANTVARFDHNHPVFTTGAKGMAPVSPGGTTSFLRADGTWNAPAGGGTVNRYSLATVGGATSQVITHGLGTQNVIVSVFRTLTPWEEVECDVEHTSTSTITLRFTVAPATNEYTVVVMG